MRSAYGWIPPEVCALRKSNKSPSVFAGLVAVALAGGLYLGLSGGHSQAALQRVEAGSRAVMGLISDGDAVELTDFAAPEGRTVFEFSASWCGGCRRVAPIVEDAVRARDDTVLRIIDIGSWESPVARRYGVRAIPHLVLFESGEMVASGTASVLERLAD